MLDPNVSLSSAEVQLVQRLRRHPQLADQLQSLLELADTDPRTVASIDEIEEPLIQRLRQVGNRTLQSFATGLEADQGERLRAKQPRARVKKKAPDVV
jgi:hypothetical protein